MVDDIVEPCHYASSVWSNLLGYSNGIPVQVRIYRVGAVVVQYSNNVGRRKITLRVDPGSGWVSLERNGRTLKKVGKPEKLSGLPGAISIRYLK